jgi:hypothetical protein
MRRWGMGDFLGYGLSCGEGFLIIVPGFGVYGALCVGDWDWAI